MLQDELYSIIAKLAGSIPVYGDVPMEEMMSCMKHKRCVYISLRGSFDANNEVLYIYILKYNRTTEIIKPFPSIHL